MGKRSPIGKIIHSKWININTRAINGKYRVNCNKNNCYNNVKITFTREEFKNYCLINKDYILSLKNPSVDRIDSNGDYSLNNIRFIELEENVKRKQKGNKFITNSQGLKRGIRKVGIKFVSRICFDKKEIYLGIFNTEEEAYSVFKEKYKELYGKYPF